MLIFEDVLRVFFIFLGYLLGNIIANLFQGKF